MARRAFLCDFDGTVSPRDLGHEFVTRFSTGGAAWLETLAERWRSGAIGHRELTEAEVAQLRCSAAEAHAFAREFSIDPSFAPFVRAAEARGDAVMVVSEGFDFYIRDLLERAGLGAIEVASNRLRFAGDRVAVEFPHAARSCGRCGNCKAAHARDWRSRGYRVVVIGDGFSDRCAAREADVVLAQGALLEWCGREGVECEPFTSFDAVLASPALEATA